MTFRDFIRILKRPEVLLSLAAPLIGVVYAVGEHSGVWDHVSGRERATVALRRLERATGYPKSWIYDSGSDRQIFIALLRRLEHQVPKETAIELQKAGLKPVLITVGGMPLQLEGMPEDWNQSDRSYFSPAHPVLLIYGSKIDDKGSISHGKAARVGSLGGVNEQLATERANWRFYVGTLMTSFLSISFIILRFAMKTEKITDAANNGATGQREEALAVVSKSSVI